MYIYSVTFVTFFEASGASTKLTLMCCVSPVFFHSGKFLNKFEIQVCTLTNFGEEKTLQLLMLLLKILPAESWDVDNLELRRIVIGKYLKMASIGSRLDQVLRSISRFSHPFFSLGTPPKSIPFSAFRLPQPTQHRPLLSNLSVYNMPFLLELEYRMAQNRRKNVENF